MGALCSRAGGGAPQNRAESHPGAAGLCADGGRGLAPRCPQYHSRAVPLRPASLRGQEPSRKGTLRGTAQTFPATLAWPGRGLYLDLQEKPGERRLVTFQPCPLLSSSGRRLANGWPVTSPPPPLSSHKAAEAPVAADTHVPTPCRSFSRDSTLCSWLFLAQGESKPQTPRIPSS